MARDRHHPEFGLATLRGACARTACAAVQEGEGSAPSEGAREEEMIIAELCEQYFFV